MPSNPRNLNQTVAYFCMEIGLGDMNIPTYSGGLGTTLSNVFQLAHTVEKAEFPLPHPDTGCIENAWAVHQAETTVDFVRRSRVVAWLLGGLNFQIEHHLFPRISHINYPTISPIVETTCNDFGVRYTEHKSFRAGLASHYRWLRQMGHPDGYQRQ